MLGDLVEKWHSLLPDAEILPISALNKFGTDLILKRIGDWEEQLADCGPAGHPETLADLSDDLRDFLLNNRSSIEGLIQEASAGMGELY